MKSLALFNESQFWFLSSICQSLSKVSQFLEWLFLLKYFFFTGGLGR